MTNTTSPKISSVPRSDLILGMIALVAAVLYVALQPRVNPDALVDYRLTADEAVEAARSFLAANQIDAAGLDAHPEWRRNVELLEVMQATRGRDGLMTSGDSQQAFPEPLHFALVTFADQDAPDETLYGVRLTNEGQPWSFTSSATVARRTVDRDLVDDALIEDGAVLGLSDTATRSLPDSVLAARLRFEPSGRPPSELRDGEPARARRPPFAMSLVGAEYIAKTHLAKYRIPGWPSEVDSSYVQPGERVAHVLFRNPDGNADSLGHATTVRVTVAPDGLLHGLIVQHTLVEEPAQAGEAVKLTTVSVIVAGAVFVLLAVVLLVFFFRRLIARAIDVKAALIDALVFSLMFVAFILTANGIIRDGGVMWIRLLAVAATIVVGGTVVSLGAFIVSGAADSLARRSWSKKLFTTSLVRQGALINSFVASSVLRGLAIGLVILAVTTLMMWIFRSAPVSLNSSTFGGQSFRPALGALGLSGLTAYLKAVVVVLTVAALLHRPKKLVWPTLVAATLALTLALVSPVSFESAWLNWASSAAVAIVATLTFLRYDLLTLFSAFSSSSLVWYLQEGWLISGSPVWADLLAASIFLGLIVGVCVVGLRKGQSVPGGGEYVPSYIRELRQQERLQSELAIAHEVQESFLPRETPDVQHLDIAATCIPAEEVGGDYYDLIKISEHELAVAVGDVSGKGIQASFFMTLAKGFLRTLSRERTSPAAVLAQMNRLFMECAPRGVFISMVYGIVDVSDGTFRFARAGHNPVLVLRATGEAQVCRPAGMGIGLDLGNGFDRHIEEAAIKLDNNDILIFYTDGFSEARDDSNREFGDARLKESVEGADSDTASMLLDDVCEVVDNFVAGAKRHDDMTMLVLRYTGRAASES